mgnify:CR=1 FL=1
MALPLWCFPTKWLTCCSGNSWLYDLIFDVAKKTIRTDAETMVAQQVTTLLNTMANKALSGLPLHIPISATEQLDLSMVGQPSYPQGQGISFYSRGEFQNITNPSEAPLPHTGFADISPTQMVSFDVDPFLLNSLLYLMYTAGTLEHMVTQADIPPQFPFKLNTVSENLLICWYRVCIYLCYARLCCFVHDPDQTSFKGALPNLYQAYPNEAVAWLFSARSPPGLAVCPQNASFTADFYMTWLAMDQGTWKEAFTLDMYLVMPIALNLNATALTGRLLCTVTARSRPYLTEHH